LEKFRLANSKLNTGAGMTSETNQEPGITYRLASYFAGLVFAAITYVMGIWGFAVESAIVHGKPMPNLWMHIKRMVPEHPFTLIAWVCSITGLSVAIGYLFDREVFFRRRAELKANVDGLTGCYNHRYFQDRLTAEIERSHRYGRRVAIAMFDLDDFKAFNDRCGHQQGDRLLTWFAEVCQANIRVIDVLARYGGEEFIIIFPETSSNEALQVANRIRQVIEAEGPVKFSGVPSVTVSVGVAAYPEHGKTRHTLILNADTALYYAKQTGKNRAVVYEENYKKSYRTNSDRLRALIGGSHMEAIEALAAAVDAKDHYTRGHSDSVAKYSLALAKRLGLSTTEMENLKAAALLHDIGKIGTPDSILRKPGPLKIDEWQVIEDHPRIGSEILERVQQLNSIVPAVRHHHERYDGLGYPCGLAGKNIPLIARIIALADAYDAMVSDRTYRSALSSGEALEEIKRCAGTQFDPELVQMFVEIIQSEKQGKNKGKDRDDNREAA